MQVAREYVYFAYAEIFVRPLARRDERTARPPFVDMRARKPCFLARLRLFGWKVRFVVISNPLFLPLVFGRPAGHMGPQLAEGVTVGESVDNGQTVGTVGTVGTVKS